MIGLQCFEIYLNALWFNVARFLRYLYLHCCHNHHNSIQLCKIYYTENKTIFYRIQKGVLERMSQFCKAFISFVFKQDTSYYDINVSFLCVTFKIVWLYDIYFVNAIPSYNLCFLYSLTKMWKSKSVSLVASL